MSGEEKNHPSSAAVPLSDDPATLHRQNETALQEIEAAIAREQPLTSERLPLSSLESQYASSSSEAGGSNKSYFREGLRALQAQHYTHVRTVRGDGNCYFRAFLYALLEHIILLQHNNNEATTSNTTEAQRLLDYFQHQSWKDVLAAGYEEMALEVFYDAMVELLQSVVSPPNNPTTTSMTDAAAKLHQELNAENSTSDYCTWYLRVVTATHLKKDPDRFLPFLLQQQQPGTEFLDMNQFCARCVEPMGQECEQLQVLALAEAVGVGVRIEYLDGRPLRAPDTNELHHHEFGPSTDDDNNSSANTTTTTRLTLLYRPGHYDILYKM